MDTSFGSLINATVRWVKDNWIRTIVFSVVSFLVCWGWNIWLLARAAGGGGSDDVAQTDSVATSAGGSSLNSIYWLVASSIGFGLFTYGRERGFANALGDLLRVPKSIAESFRTSAAGALAILLWGVVIGLGIGGFMPAALSGALGVGFVLLSVTPVAAILNNVLIRLFVGITSANAPNLRVVLAGMAAPFLMMVGEAVGLFACQIGGLSAGPALVAAVVFAVLAYVLGAAAGKAVPSAAFLLVVVGLALAGAGVLAGPAAADDGGWAECFDTETGEPCKGLSGIKTWWDSPGASELRQEARTGGFFGAAGAVAGAALGGALGSVAKARRGWKLPGGGFGTESVQLDGPKAADLLQSKGLVEPVGDGTYKWVGAEPPDAVGAKLAGLEVGGDPLSGKESSGGKVVRAAVDAPARPDGLIDGKDLTVQAEVLPPAEGAPAKAAFEAPAGGAKGAFDLPGSEAGGKGAFDVPAEAGGEVKAFDAGAGGVSGAEASAGEAGGAKGAFDLPGSEAGGEVKAFDAGGGVSGAEAAAGEAGGSKGAFDLPGSDAVGKGAFDLPAEDGGEVKAFDAGAGVSDAEASAGDGGGGKGAFDLPDDGGDAAGAKGAEAADAGDSKGTFELPEQDALPEDVLPDEDKFRRRDEGGDGEATS